jgi:hypothetical protein
MYNVFQKDGFDYFTDMMPALHNYVTVDTKVPETQVIVRSSVADPGCLSRFLIFTQRGVKKICCHTFFVAKIFTKLKIILFLKC